MQECLCSPGSTVCHLAPGAYCTAANQTLDWKATPEPKKWRVVPSHLLSRKNSPNLMFCLKICTLLAVISCCPRSITHVCKTSETQISVQFLNVSTVGGLIFCERGLAASPTTSWEGLCWTPPTSPTMRLRLPPGNSAMSQNRFQVLFPIWRQTKRTTVTLNTRFRDAGSAENRKKKKILSYHWFWKLFRNPLLLWDMIRFPYCVLRSWGGKRFHLTLYAHIAPKIYSDVRRDFCRHL